MPWIRDVPARDLCGNARHEATQAGAAGHSGGIFNYIEAKAGIVVGEDGGEEK